MSGKIKVRVETMKPKKCLSIELKRFSKQEIERLTGSVSSELEPKIISAIEIRKDVQPKDDSGRITRSKSRLQTSNNSTEISADSAAEKIRSKRKWNKIQDSDSENNNVAKRAKVERQTKSNKSNEQKRPGVEYQKQISEIEFKLKDIVWAKIKGFPAWPAIIKEIKYGQRISFEIEWFNDYRRSTVNKTQMYNFCANFERFSVNFSKHIGVETAAKEALMYMASSKN